MMLTNGQAPVSYEATLHFDGGAAPNPGNGGCGYVLSNRYGQELEVGCIEMMESRVTSNEAEYSGLINGMICALKYNVRTLHIKGDSELVIKQCNCVYNCNSPTMREYLQRVRSLESSFSNVKFEWIPRHQNGQADQNATDGIKGYGAQRMHKSHYI
jgi:ribonuclease HI